MAERIYAVALEYRKALGPVRKKTSHLFAMNTKIFSKRVLLIDLAALFSNGVDEIL